MIDREYVGQLQEPFLSNPFRLLRVSSDASEETILSGLQEARIRIRLTNNEASEDALRRAQVGLLDRNQREGFAASWFHTVPASLLVDAFLPSEETLATYLTAGDTQDDLEDLGNWYLVLATHATTPAEIEELTWGSIETWWRAREESRGTLPSHVSGAISASILRHLQAGSTGNAKAHLSALRRGVDETTRIEVAEPGLSLLAQATASAIAQAQESGDVDLNRANSIYHVATNLSELAAAIGESVPIRYLDTLNSACGSIRSIGISLHNDLGRTDDALKAIQLAAELTTADTNERIQSDLTDLREELRLKKFLGAIQRCIDSIKARNWDYALAARSEAESLASTFEEKMLVEKLRLQIAELSQGFFQRLPWGKVLGWGTTALVIAAIAGLRALGGAAEESASTSPSRQPTPSTRSIPASIPTVRLPQDSTVPAIVPTARPPVVVPTPDTRRANLNATITANQARLGQLKGQIASFDGTLETLGRQADAVEAQINSIINQHAIGNALPEPYYTQYQGLRNQFNGLVNQYNSTLNQRNGVAAEHDALLRETNLLVDQYNALR